MLFFILVKNNSDNILIAIDMERKMSINFHHGWEHQNRFINFKIADITADLDSSITRQSAEVENEKKKNGGKEKSK